MSSNNFEVNRIELKIFRKNRTSFSDGLYRRLARFDAEKGSIEWLGGEEPDGNRCWNYRYTNSSSKKMKIWIFIRKKKIVFFCCFRLANEKRRQAPFDQLQISRQVQEISHPLYLTMSCFAGLGLFFAIVCLILNLVYRKRK